MPTKPRRSTNPRVAELEAITDPTARARACQDFLTNGRDTLRVIERIRDESIREARKADPRPTIDAIAAATGASRAVVVNALRGTRN